jgi:hypothetical protein
MKGNGAIEIIVSKEGDISGGMGGFPCTAPRGSGWAVACTERGVQRRATHGRSAPCNRWIHFTVGSPFARVRHAHKVLLFSPRVLIRCARMTLRVRIALSREYTQKRAWLWTGKPRCGRKQRKQPLVYNVRILRRVFFFEIRGVGDVHLAKAQRRTTNAHRAAFDKDGEIKRK